MRLDPGASREKKLFTWSREEFPPAGEKRERKMRPVTDLAVALAPGAHLVSPWKNTVPTGDDLLGEYVAPRPVLAGPVPERYHFVTQICHLPQRPVRQKQV